MDWDWSSSVTVTTPTRDFWSWSDPSSVATLIDGDWSDPVIVSTPAPILYTDTYYDDYGPHVLEGTPKIDPTRTRTIGSGHNDDGPGPGVPRVVRIGAGRNDLVEV